jgi:hypothetical protein
MKRANNEKVNFSQQIVIMNSRNNTYFQLIIGYRSDVYRQFCRQMFVGKLHQSFIVVFRRDVNESVIAA